MENIANWNSARHSNVIYWHKIFIACQIKTIPSEWGLSGLGETTPNANLGPFSVSTDKPHVQYVNSWISPKGTSVPCFNQSENKSFDS